MMEQVEVTKTDIERKVERILKLVKRRNRSKKEPELVALVEDFHKQYQSLYAQYDSLRQESGKKAVDGKGNESCSYYASGSESEYYSSEDIEINTAISNDKSSNRRAPGNMEEELKRAYAEVEDLKHQLASKTEEKQAFTSNHLAALSKIKEIETINSDMRKEVTEKEKRISALGNVHKGRVTELEEQIAGLKTELEALHHQKRVSEAQLDGKTAEIKQQGETNRAPYLQTSEEGYEVTKLMKQIKDNEDNLTSKLEDSMAQLSNMKKELDCLHSKKIEAKGSIACKSNESFDQANIMKQELDSLRSQKAESEMMVERKSRDISQYLIQVKTLKEELARKVAVEQMMVEEKEGLQVQVMDLESEVDALRKQKTKSEDEERKNNREINQLREENGRLNARILELEAQALFRERGPAISALQEDSDCKKTKESAQNMTLNSEIELLQQKLDTMKMEKGKLELQIADQQRIAKEREESANKSMESNSKLVRRLSTGNKLNCQVLERKMEDLAQEFRKKLEDNIRILYQRITVAEKIHYENTEMYKNIKETLEQENEALKQKLATCGAKFNKLSDTTEPSNKAWIELNSVANKLEENNNGNSLTDIANVADELASTTNDCDTGKKDGMKQVKSHVNLVIAEMDQKENEEQLLQEKVLKLEAELSKEGEEKLKLLKAVSELEKRVTELEKVKKEKEETLLGLGEEKREAIRQLCLLIDYHRSRCDTLKELISKFTVRIKKKT